MRKKLFQAITLFLVMMFMFSSVAFAAEEVGDDALVEEMLSEDELNLYLLENSFPLYIIDTMDMETKRIYYQEKAEFLGAVTSCYDEEFELVAQYDQNSMNTLMQRGAIDERWLDISVSIAQAGNSSSRYLIVRMTYDWKIHPNDKFVDKLALSWSTGTLSMIDGTFIAYDKQVDMNGEVTNNRTTTRYSQGSDAGCAWYAYLRDGESGYRLKGSGMVYVNPSQLVGTVTVYGTYVHTKENVDVSYNFGSGGGVTINCNRDYDEAGTQATISYNLTN